MGAPKCRMSVLRNVGIVELLCHSFSCYQIELMKELFPMLLYLRMVILHVIKPYVACRKKEMPMLPHLF